MSGNQEEAEDITQDVFIKIFHVVGKFRADAKLSSGIYRIAVNTCLKHERRKKLENRISLEFLFREGEKFQPLSTEEAADQQMKISKKAQIMQQAIHEFLTLIVKRKLRKFCPIQVSNIILKGIY